MRGYRYWGMISLLGAGLALTLAGCGGGSGGGGTPAVGSDTSYEKSYVKVSTLAGTSTPGSTDGPALTQATFKAPTGLTLGIMNGNNYLFVADTGISMIRLINLSNQNSVSTLIGKQTYTGTDGTSVTIVNSNGLFCDNSGNLFVGDIGNKRILKINCDDGTDVTTAADSSKGVNGPTGIVAHGSTFYVVNNTGSTIQWITSGGYGTLAGGTEGYNESSSSATGTAARFDHPFGIASDGTNLYVTDSDNNTIRKIVISGTTGTVTTLAGNPTASGSTDGARDGALFRNPTGITYNEDDQCLYIADTGNHVIRKVTASGVVTTIAGHKGISGSSDSLTLGNDAYFSSPTGIVYNGNGKLYVADKGNNKIRMVDLTVK